MVDIVLSIVLMVIMLMLLAIVIQHVLQINLEKIQPLHVKTNVLLDLLIMDYVLQYAQMDIMDMIIFVIYLVHLEPQQAIQQIYA